MKKTITFGSNDASLIIDSQEKKSIIDYLFNTLDLSKYRFNILNNLQRLKFLKQNQHYVAPNFRGYSYLLIFKKIKGVKYAVAIDRRKLKYQRSQVDINKVFIVNLKMKTTESIFRGTIFDGKLINSNNKYIFLIQDCYHLMGNNFLSTELDQKMQLLDNLLNNQFTKSKSDNFIFKINKLYSYNDLPNLINTVMKNCSITCQGLIFFPKFSGITIIYLEKRNDEIPKDKIRIVEAKSYDMIVQLEEFLKSRNYSYEKNSKKKKFWLKPTEITDVYNLYDENTFEKVDIAHIPNLKTSHLCYQETKDGEKKKFNCIYFNKFKKWIPLNLVN